MAYFKFFISNAPYRNPQYESKLHAGQANLYYKLRPVLSLYPLFENARTYFIKKS